MGDWADAAAKKGTQLYKKLEQYKLAATNGGFVQAFGNKLSPTEQANLTAGLCGHRVDTAASGS